MNAPLKTIRDRYIGEQIAAFYAAGYWQPTSFNALVVEQAARRGGQTFVFDCTTSPASRARSSRDQLQQGARRRRSLPQQACPLPLTILRGKLPDGSDLTGPFAVAAGRGAAATAACRRAVHVRTPVRVGPDKYPVELDV
jgi:hypothetical protein